MTELEIARTETIPGKLPPEGPPPRFVVYMTTVKPYLMGTISPMSQAVIGQYIDALLSAIPPVPITFELN